MKKARETAINILELFEDLLERNNITIPDRDREGNKEEARLYGLNYYELEDNITEIIKRLKWAKKLKNIGKTLQK